MIDDKELSENNSLIPSGELADNNLMVSDPQKITSAKELNEYESEIVQSIIEAPNKEVLEQQFELFNITQSKKNAIRVSKLNKLLDMIEDQAIDRFTKRPDQISNKELLEYMGVIATRVERAKNDVSTDLAYKPTIAVTQNKTEVNVNVGPELSRDSKEKVMDAISQLLKQAATSSPISSNGSESEDPIDITETVVDSFSDSTDNLLYDENDE